MSERVEVPEPAPLPPAAVYPAVPPSRVSSNPKHEWFHPSTANIMVWVNGKHRPDVHRYDQHEGMAWSIHRSEPETGVVVTVSWKGPENRQQRRNRERWEQKTRWTPPPAWSAAEHLGTASPPGDEAQLQEKGSPLWEDQEGQRAERPKVGSLALGLAAAAAFGLGRGR